MQLRTCIIIKNTPKTSIQLKHFKPTAIYCCRAHYLQKAYTLKFELCYVFTRKFTKTNLEFGRTEDAAFKIPHTIRPTPQCLI